MVAIGAFASHPQTKINSCNSEKGPIILAGFFSAVYLVADGYCPEVIFLLEHFVKQMIELVHR